MLPRNAAALTALVPMLAALSAAPGARGQHIAIQRHSPVAMIEQMLDMGLSALDLAAFDDFGVGTSRTNTLLSVGCTPVRTLHRAVTRGENETVLSLYVSQTCPEGRAPIPDAVVSLEAGGLVVAAEGLFPPQRLPLDPRADPAAIAARYDEAAATLTVTIPHKAPETRRIPVETLPAAPRPDAAPQVAGADPTAAATRAAEEEDARREEYVRASVESLERELERIKGRIAAPPSTAPAAPAAPAAPRGPTEL